MASYLVTGGAVLVSGGEIALAHTAAVLDASLRGLGTSALLQQKSG